MKKTNAFGSYSRRIIFLDSKKEEEWKSLPEDQKKFALEHLDYVASKMSNEIAIEMLCHVINDLIARINALEERQSVGKG